MSFTEQDVLNALKQIQDPDLHQDIVSLGFIKNMNIDSGKVAASFKDGVLTVSLPKPPEVQKQSKKIEVRSSS